MRANRVAKIIALVLGSAWLIPVSCTTVGVSIAHLDSPSSEASWAKAVGRDSRMPQRFHVVCVPGADGAAFSVLNLAQIEEFKRSHAVHGFLMLENTGELESHVDHSIYRYKVLGRTPAEQEIEVAFSDGDNDSISRYRATASQVVPISWRRGPLDRGILMPALASGFVFALALYLAGKLLGWFLRRTLGSKYS